VIAGFSAAENLPARRNDFVVLFHSGERNPAASGKGFCEEKPG